MNVHPGTEASVHPAFCRDLQQPVTLRFIQVPDQSNLPLDLIDPLFQGLLVSFIIPGSPPVAQANLDVLQGNIFPLRIHAQCYRRSCT